MRELRRRCTLLLGGLLLALPAPPMAQTRSGNAAEAAKAVRLPEAPATTAVIRYNPDNRRDPFLDPLANRKRPVDPDAEAPRGQQPPGIAGMYIAQVRLVGIANGETLTAVFEGTDKRSYFLKERDKLFDGYIKKIEADSVILIRETKLMSGKVVTQDVVKRLRTP